MNHFSDEFRRYFTLPEGGVVRKDFLRALVTYSERQFDTVNECIPMDWDVNVRQVRVVGTTDHMGLPSPEGIHHDGEDFLTIHLIKRWNVKGGRTIVYTPVFNPACPGGTVDSSLIRSMIDDAHVLHYTEPIMPAEGGRAVRDVLLLGFRRAATRASLTDKEYRPTEDVQNVRSDQVGI